MIEKSIMLIFLPFTTIITHGLKFSTIHECYKQFDYKGYKPHPDMHLRTDEIIRRHGYPVEIYTISTDDGYILKLFRIPGSVKFPPTEKKQPVLLVHGLATSSSSWLIHPNNLAFKLADENFDVWLFNNRGNSYSNKHFTLTPKDKQYWDFSFEKIGTKDIPKTIELIINVTKQPKINFIGHSLGGTVYLVAMSELPELNKFISKAVLYAPVGYVGNSRNKFLKLAPLIYNLQPTFRRVIAGRLFWISEEYQHLQRLLKKQGSLCAYSKTACGICSKLYFEANGKNPGQMNFTLLSFFFNVIPESISTKTIIHLAQLVTSKKFQKFDYGSSNENEAKYGQFNVSPPEYDLSKITAPTDIFWGDGDQIVTLPDIAHTSYKIGGGSTVIKMHKVNWTGWTHEDFILGIDADSLVYDKTVDIFKNNCL